MTTVLGMNGNVIDSDPMVPAINEELAWFRSWTTRAFGADRSRWPDEDREWIEQQEREDE